MSWRTFRFLVQPASVVALAGLLLGPSGGLAENSRRYGVNVHAPTGGDLTQIFDATRAAGLGWVRVDFVWAFIESSPNHFDWTVYDAIVDAAAARGLSVLAILAYTPRWATDGSELSGVPRDSADWRDFCFKVADRYRGRVERFELWNEPNQNAFWAGSRQQYIDLILRPGSEAIHQANAAARTGGPGLAHLTAGDSDWYRWLYDILRQAPETLDFVTHHLYDRDGDADVTKKLTGSTRFANQPDLWDIENPSLRELLKYVAWYPSRPVWLTETGWNSAQVGEAAQATYSAGILDSWFTGREGMSWIERLFFYEARDNAGSAFGLLHADGSAKPALGAVQTFIANHDGVPPTDTTLHLFANRFDVQVRWRTSDGVTGVGHAVTLTDRSGEFWFFDAGTIELVVKTLDGRGLNHRYWFFYGALSNVEYWITVTDTVTHATKEYHNPPGNICGQADTSAFRPGLANAFEAKAWATPAEAGAGVAAPSCVADARALCLQGGRFRVQVSFHDHSGGGGDGHPVPATNESGQFWFFDASNIELVLKVLDGRRVNGKWWVLWGALSDVEYDLSVTDTTTGKIWRHHNANANFCGGADTLAF